MNQSIGIIGHFGGNRAFTDGQTVKTKSLYNGLIRTGQIKIICADTYFIKTNPIKFVFQFFKVIIKTSKIIVLLSHRGRNVLFPILRCLCKNKDIYHYVIGGKIAEDARHSKETYKQICSIKCNWVESTIMKKELNDIGINNVEYVPNFKCLNKCSINELKKSFERPFPFCTFSRVIREKGIEDAIDAIKNVNNALGYNAAKLDIYGPVDPNYKERFDTILEENKDYNITYQGIVSPDQSVSILKNYYMLLFPTFWYGEGMPGTILDALSSGLPVIAREWKYCHDMIEDNETGFIYDFDKPEQLSQIIIKSTQNEEDVKRMKINCLKKADEFDEKNVIKRICVLMGI